jgi:hypothetical protein
MPGVVAAPANCPVILPLGLMLGKAGLLSHLPERQHGTLHPLVSKTNESLRLS